MVTARAKRAQPPVYIDSGGYPSFAVSRLFEEYPALWRRIADAVASVLPEHPGHAFARVSFRPDETLGMGYWGFVYPTVVPRWVVKVSCDAEAGRIARLLLTRPKLRAHPGVFFTLAAWELPGYLVLAGAGRMPISVIVRENLLSATDVLPDVFDDEFVAASRLARRYNEAELFRREAAQYAQWDTAAAYAEQRRDDLIEYQRLLKLFESRKAFADVAAFLRKYLSATGEMLVDITPANMGWRAFDTRDLGGNPPGEPKRAVIRDAEHTEGRKMRRPDYLPNS